MRMKLFQLKRKKCTDDQGVSIPTKHSKSQIFTFADIPFIILIISYVILFILQINQPPFERYPNWDWFWGQVLNAGKLTALKYAILNFELPNINPYMEFGWNNLGDTGVQSFLCLPNLLILLFPPDIVLIIKTAFFLIVGGIGAYLYLRLFTKERLLSLLGGLTYISLPYVISISYYYSILHVFCLIPFVLLVLQSILEQWTTKKILLYIALSIFVISLGEVTIFIILPSVVGVYSFLISWRYYRFSFFNSFKKAFYLVSLCIL